MGRSFCILRQSLLISPAKDKNCSIRHAISIWQPPYFATGSFIPISMTMTNKYRLPSVQQPFLRGPNATGDNSTGKHFFANLESCMKNRGVCSRLAELTGFSRDLFYIWLGRKQTRYSQTPSLETILEFCYACNVTPFQVMSSADALLHAIGNESLL